EPPPCWPDPCWFTAFCHFIDHLYCNACLKPEHLGRTYSILILIIDADGSMARVGFEVELLYLSVFLYTDGLLVAVSQTLHQLFGFLLTLQFLQGQPLHGLQQFIAVSGIKF